MIEQFCLSAYVIVIYLANTWSKCHIAERTRIVF